MVRSLASWLILRLVCLPLCPFEVQEDRQHRGDTGNCLCIRVPGQPHHTSASTFLSIYRRRSFLRSVSQHNRGVILIVSLCQTPSLPCRRQCARRCSIVLLYRYLPFACLVGLIIVVAFCSIRKSASVFSLPKLASKHVQWIPPCGCDRGPSS